MSSRPDSDTATDRAVDSATDSTAAASATSPPSIFSGDLRGPTIGLVIVITLIAFEAMAVATALPTAAREVNGLAAYGWAFSGFLTANIIGMVGAGLMSDRRGPARPLLIGLVVFLAGLVVAGTATTMVQLVGGRMIQGLGAGLLITALYVVIGESYDAAIRPKIFAAISGAWVVPSLVGPPVSGFLTQHLSWRWVFLGLVPLVAVGGVLVLPALRTLKKRDPSAVPATSGAGRLVRALSTAVGVVLLEQAGQHPRLPWLALAPVGLVLLVWGLAGLLPRGTVRVRAGVPTAVALRGLLAGALFGTETLIPLSLTVQHHYGATLAGLPLLFSALGWFTGSWWQGRDGVGSRIALVRTGFCFVAIGAVAAGLASLPGVTPLLMYPGWMIAGLGAGLAMSSIGVLLLDWTNDADRGRDSAALQLSDSVTSSLTTGFGGVLLAAAAAGLIGYTGALLTACLVMAVLAVLGAVLAAGRRAPSV